MATIGKEMRFEGGGTFCLDFWRCRALARAGDCVGCTARTAELSFRISSLAFLVAAGGFRCIILILLAPFNMSLDLAEEVNVKIAPLDTSYSRNPKPAGLLISLADAAENCTASLWFRGFFSFCCAWDN